MAYTFTVSDAAIGGILTVIIVTLFIRFAAKIVLDRTSFLAALVVALLGTFLGGIAIALTNNTFDGPPWVGFAAGIATWSLVAAIVFRTRWLKGALIGLVAWILWWLVHLAIDALF